MTMFSTVIRTYLTGYLERSEEMILRVSCERLSTASSATMVLPSFLYTVMYLRRRDIKNRVKREKEAAGMVTGTLFAQHYVMVTGS